MLSASGRPSARSEPSRFVRPILQRLRESQRGDVALARKISDRSRHAECAMDAAGGHPAAVHGIRDQLSSRRIERAVLAQRSVREQRIERTALMLPLPRREDTLAHRDTRLTGGSTQQFF
jgi:hypothetical protein